MSDWVGTLAGSGVITVEAAEVKAIGGITGTDEDSRIASLITFFVRYYTAMTDPSFVSDNVVIPILNTAITLIVAGNARNGASPKSIAAGPVTAVTSGTMRTEYGTQSSSQAVSGTRLIQQGETMIAPYLRRSGSLVASSGAASPFEEAIIDSGGSTIDAGNLTGWDR